MQFALEVSVLKDELWRDEVGRSKGRVEVGAYHFDILVE